MSQGALRASAAPAGNHPSTRCERVFAGGRGWRSVCDDGWDDADAGVACSQLGFGQTGTAIRGPGSAESTHFHRFGQRAALEQVWLAELRCALAAGGSAFGRWQCIS